MKIAIFGAAGTVGSRIAAEPTRRGHTVELEQPRFSRRRITVAY